MKLPNSVTLGFIAKLSGGNVVGDQNILIDRVAENPQYSTEEDLVLVFDPKHLKELANVKAKAYIIPASYPDVLNKPHIMVDKPLFALKNILEMVKPPRFYPEKGIHPTAIIDHTAKIDPTAAIGPYVVIGSNTVIGAETIIMPNCVIGGKVKIGHNCLIYPLVTIGDYVTIGNNVILQQGSSVGADGFAYVTKDPSVIEKRLKGDFTLDPTANPHHKIPHIGSVVIEDNVELGSNSTVARGTIGDTKIGQGTKIDDLVVVAHNVIIGEECLIAGLNGFGGSARIGNKVVIAGDCGLKDHVVVGNEVIIEAMSGVMWDIKDGEVQGGIPAVNTKERFKQMAHIRQLPKIFKEFRQLKKQIQELEAKLK